MSTVAEVIDSRAFSDFCGVESSTQVPDGDTLGRFRNLLIQNNLQPVSYTHLDYYEIALERLTGKRVKEKVIYSFCLKSEIPVRCV